MIKITKIDPIGRYIATLAGFKFQSVIEPYTAELISNK